MPDKSGGGIERGVLHRAAQPGARATGVGFATPENYLRQFFAANIANMFFFALTFIFNFSF